VYSPDRHQLILSPTDLSSFLACRHKTGLDLAVARGALAKPEWSDPVGSRLYVATSRARCAAFVVASPALLELECHTPRQMALANALCRFVELARA
jgi:hypothetical protein